jgi:phosphohistidine swiveling domain-containing protein
LRKEDSFFASNDVLISKSIRSLYPDLAGFENLILLEEIYGEKPMPTRSMLEARARGAALIDGTELFVGDKTAFAQKYPNYNLNHVVVEKNITSVKGQVAFRNPEKPLISGPVKILRRRAQVGEVKPGDILVSPMTTPDFLPAMEQAAAFVTDEGGITCHAAIVAREMKKPCVIGTKVATQVFKDGDMVEVDAEKGVVRILT